MFDDSLEWTAEDIELTEHLIASADKRAPPHKYSTEVANGAPEVPIVPERRVTRSSKNLNEEAGRKGRSGARYLGRSSGKAADAAHQAAQNDEEGLQDHPASAILAVPDIGALTEAREKVYVPDLEDIGLLQDRRHFRPHGFCVTDLTASQWCQQKFALALSACLPKASLTHAWRALQSLISSGALQHQIHGIPPKSVYPDICFTTTKRILASLIPLCQKHALRQAL